MKVTQWLGDQVRKGCSPEFTEEENRRAVVINLFAIIGTVITAVLGASAYSAANYPLAISLFVIAFINSTIRVFMVVGRTQKTHNIVSASMVSTFMILLVYLIISGGKAHTGPLWILILPPVTLFLNGLRNGTAMLLVFIVVVAYLLFSSDATFVDSTYSLEFKKRLVYVYLSLTFLSAVYEYSRHQTYSEIQQLREKFERQATFDPLTNLLNRRGLKKQIAQELARAHRHNTETSVVLMDLDSFKKLNDTYGHDAGDEVLRSIAMTLTQTIRSQDYASRWGGEEFLLLLPETNKHNAAILADKIRQTLAQTDVHIEQKNISLTASFGVAEINPPTSFEQAITLADQALYDAKHQGRNRVIVG